MLQALTDHYAPQSARAAGLKEDVLRAVQINPRETCVSLMLRMQRAISDVERMQGPYTLEEKLRFLEKALSVKREPMLAQLVNTIQLNQEQPMLGMTWALVKNLVSRFDLTSSGQDRLQLGAVKGSHMDSVSAISEHNQAKHTQCDACGKKGHSAANCWKTHPEKMPKYLQERVKKRESKLGDSEQSVTTSKRAKFSFSAAKGEDSVSMVEDNDPEWLIQAQRGTVDDDLIFLYSCAMNNLLLLRS